jgi:hypothetical protein
LTGRVLDVVEQLSGVFDFGARCGIHFDQVNEATFGDGCAGGAFAAGYRTDALFAVEAFSKNACDGRFTDTTSPGEQVSVVQTLSVKGIDKGFEHVLLPHHFSEAPGPPFSRKYLITHEISATGKERWAPS